MINCKPIFEKLYKQLLAKLAEDVEVDEPFSAMMIDTYYVVFEVKVYHEFGSHTFDLIFSDTELMVTDRYLGDLHTPATTNPHIYSMAKQVNPNFKPQYAFVIGLSHPDFINAAVKMFKNFMTSEMRK